MTFRRVGDERSDVERWVVGRMALAAAALVLAFVGLLRSARWRVWPRRERIAVALLLAASMEDWVSHALGAPTPLDLAFKEWGAER